MRSSAVVLAALLVFTSGSASAQAGVPSLNAAEPAPTLGNGQTAPRGWDWSGKGKPVPTGATDLPYPFEPGVLQFKLARGVALSATLATHQLSGTVRTWLTPPFTMYDKLGGMDRWYRLEVPPGREKTLVGRLARAAAFEYVGLHWLRPGGAFTHTTPNDPKYAGGNQPNLPALNMPAAWHKTTSSPDVVIAFVDSGLWGTHEEVGGKQVAAGCDFSAGQSPCTPIAPGDRSDGCGHGTRMATLGAGGTNNNAGIASTGYNSVMMTVKLLRSDCALSTTVSKAEPIRFAYNNGAQIINMSYGYDDPTNQGGDAMEANALNTAWNVVGVANVSAAGNSGTTIKHYPCAHDWVICLGASDDNGNKWPSSNSGSWVDFAAPGTSILAGSNAADTGEAAYASASGTSEASAEVAGILALLKSVGKSPNAQMDALVATARPVVPAQWVVYGFVDAGAAVNVP